MKAIDFLRGLFLYPFETINLNAIMFKRSIPLNAMADQVTTKQLDLAQADLFELLYTLFTRATTTKKHGNWVSTVGGMTITKADKDGFRDSANDI